jgi:hypothetical protein
MPDPKKTEPTAQTPGEIREVLKRCTPADFDGHTDFDRLTASQRLDWLAQAAAFVHEFKGAARRKSA